MEFRLLGPLDVVEHDQSLALGGPKQRALLAVLLLHANDVVSTERLIDELWGESPPATVAKSVQVYVSRLRKQLGEDRLVTRTPGYVLRVEPSELDVARFEQLVAEAAGAGPDRAADKLRDALALWRGPPLADLAYEPFAPAPIARLEERRLVALEQRIDAELTTGRHAELVGEVGGLVAQHPLRERLRSQLMLCLYRSGRQAEALAAFAEARRALSDELGLEPGRELGELQAAILRHDPALDPRPAAEPSSPPPRGVFVGRERELAVLSAGLDDALAGRGRLLLVAGEPGIGKSRLIDELIGRARACGARVLVGRCWEAGGAPAYWPWVQAWRAYARETDPDMLRAQLGPGAADLAQLLPELRERFPGLPELPALEPEGARFRLFEAATAFLRRAAAAGPLVLVLDDLHAADEPSLLLLRFVAREIADSGLLVVCAFRDVDPTLSDPLTEALAQLIREPPTARLELARLGRRDVAEYIERATGISPPPRAAEAIHAETEGNPLFVVEVVSLLDAEGGIAQAVAQGRIPPGIRAVIDQRVGRLSAPCRDLLGVAAVLGREFALDVLARLSELSRDRLLEQLDEALAERIVGDVPGSPNRLRFGHALIRDALYEGLTTAARLRLHQRAAEALEAVYGSDLEPHLAELAQHFFAAAAVGVKDDAVAYARRAGDRAVSLLAYEEAARLYEMALTLVDEPLARCELLLVLGDARARAGDTPAAKHAFREAADLAARGGMSEHLGRAALGYGGRIIWEVSRDDEHLVPLLERALAGLGDGAEPMRVRLLARLAGGPLRDASFPPERKAALSQEALETARRLDDPATLAYGIHGYILGHHSPAHTPRQLELATELIEVAARAGDAERILDGREERLVALVELGDVRGARVELEHMARLAAELRQPAHHWLVATYRTVLALLEGRLAEAEKLAATARGLGERALSWIAEEAYRLQLYVLRCEQGRHDEVEGLVRASVTDYPTYPIWRCVQTHLAARAGRATEARETLDVLAADGFRSLPVDEEWLVGLSLLAETACVLGDAERAAILYDLLLPYGHRITISYPEVSIGSVARYLGLLASGMERWEEAGEQFEAALETHRRIGARSWLAHTQADYAQMLLARAAPADRVRATELLAGARAAFRDLDMPG